MRVSLRLPSEPWRAPTSDGPTPAPLLDPNGPRLLLGSRSMSFDQMQSVTPDAAALFGPRGAALAGEGGPLIVADTGHHRLMIWRRTPDEDYAPADILIGQADFSKEGRNARGEPAAATLNVPTGVAANGTTLAVADAWNHRVLIWHGLPSRDNQPADVVLGQADFSGARANRGGEPRADTLNWCYGVAFADNHLIVCDTGNRRVLLWDEIPKRNGAPADLVLGQADMGRRDENAGRGVDAHGMRWPHAAALLGARLFVADSGDNRVMVWDRLPQADGAPCDHVVGQNDFSACEHNRASYLPDAASLNMPYACAAFGDMLAVADTANSRLLGFSAADIATGASAVRLCGQPDFHAKGDNRWRAAARDSLCWPYGLNARGYDLVIADSGNNRVMLWRRAS